MGQGNPSLRPIRRRPSKAEVGDVIMISRYLVCPDADNIARKANAKSSTSLFMVFGVVIGIRREQRMKAYDVALRCKRCGQLVQATIYGDEFMSAESVQKLLGRLGTSVKALMRRSGLTMIRDDKHLRIALKKEGFSLRTHPVLLQDGPEAYYCIRGRLQRRQVNR